MNSPIIKKREAHDYEPTVGGAKFFLHIFTIKLSVNLLEFKAGYN